MNLQAVIGTGDLLIGVRRKCKHQNQLMQSVRTANLEASLQSTYRERHSTETAIVKIVNDMLRSLDDHLCVLLIMLDLSAASDTIDHKLLLHRFETSFGIQAEAKK